MGAAATVLSQDRQKGSHILMLETLPSGVYVLQEKHFKTGSFYGVKEFEAHRWSCPLFGALGLHEWSISQIWRQFRQMNETASGGITLWEFREYFDLPDDRSTTRLFRCFDEDRDNRIGFVELVVGLWTYCCNCNASLMCLCFDLYDADHNGQISLEEADFMLQDVFGAEWATNDEARALHIWLHERDAALLGAPDLGIDDWSTFVSANLHIQAAAVRTRLILQKKIIGVGFWTHSMRKTAAIYVGGSTTMEKILSAHVSSSVLETLAQDRNPASDHDDKTQFTLKVLRRTGPFPRRRKYRDHGGLTLAPRTPTQKCAVLTVRKTFERLTVPAGEDAMWEEPKTPSSSQVLMASLAAICERPAPGAQFSSAIATRLAYAEKPRHKFGLSPALAPQGPPEALHLLRSQPGIGGVPLGSPSATAAGSGTADTDPAIANAFRTLEPLRSPARHPDAEINDLSSSRRPTPARKKGLHSRPRSATLREETAGRGKITLARVGKTLVNTGDIRRVGSPGEGDGGGGEGAMITRLLTASGPRVTTP